MGTPDAPNRNDATQTMTDGMTDDVSGAPSSGSPSPPWTSPTKRIAAIGMVIAAVYVLFLARGAITLVALAVVISFLLAPLVRGLNRRLRFPKVLALLTTYVVFLISLLFIGVVVTNGVIGSVAEVDPPKAVESLRSTALDTLDKIEVVNLFGYQFDLSEVVNPLREQLQGKKEAVTTGTSTTGTSTDSSTDGTSTGASTGETSVTPATPSTDREVSADGDELRPDRIILGRDNFNLFAGTAARSLATVGGAVLAILLSSIVMLLIALYLNLDSHKFHRAVVRYVPQAYQSDMAKLGAQVTGIWHGYMYGQLLNSLATGVLVYIALVVIGLPGAFVLAVIMVLLNMIPTFGPIIAAAPAVLSAFALGSTRFDMSNITFALLVVAIYLVVVQLQANVMAPFVTGRSVRMSPAAILIGLLVGVQVAGLIGAVLVVPVMATGKCLFRYGMSKLVDRDPFADINGIDDDDEEDDENHDDLVDEPSTRTVNSGELATLQPENSN